MRPPHSTQGRPETIDYGLDLGASTHVGDSDKDRDAARAAAWAASSPPASSSAGRRAERGYPTPSVLAARLTSRGLTQRIMP